MGLTGVRAVFFDAVGTLLYPDPPAAAIYAQVGRRFGSNLSIDVIQKRFAVAFAHEEEIDRRQGLRTSEEREKQRWQRIVAHVFLEGVDAAACFEALYHHFSSPEAWRCAGDTGGVMDELARRGYLLGMASNYDRRLRSVAEGLAALRHITHLVISSEVGWRKPAPAFFSALCEAARLPAQQILFVGDDPDNDYEGARAAGLRAVLFDPQDRSRPGTERIRSLAELVAAGNRDHAPT